MDFLTRPPQPLLDALPAGARGFLQNGGWPAALAVAALLALWVLWRLVAGRRPRAPKNPAPQAINLGGIPDAPPGTPDRRLQVDGVPVRVRLVVMAPTGSSAQLTAEMVQPILNKILPGLGDLAVRDRPVVKVWPPQVSHEGFANQFHRSTPVPEGERQPTRWVLVAGRAAAAGGQVMVGLGLQAVKPTTVGRLRLDKHEWPERLRIKTRD